MDEVNRLFDMRVEEVSLVDRAANQHRFLVVKREDGMAEEAEVAAESLERLTEAVSRFQAENPTEAQVSELAGALRSAADALKAPVEVKSPEEAKPAPLPNEASVATALRELTALIQAQQQRLEQVEKRFGLPNSAATSEKSVQVSAEEIGWPMDLNTPLDKASVDKRISFHEV